MKFMLFVHHVDAPRPDREGEGNRGAVAAFENLSDEEKGAVYAAYQEINGTPGVTPGMQLRPPETATTVRVQDGKPLISDGPFAEAKEAINGFFVYEADDLDAAIELAGKVPAARMGGAVEVRPIVE